MKRDTWSPIEVEELRRLYPRTLTSEIARQFKRRESSVYGKAQQLGLKKDPAYFETDASGRFRKGAAFSGKAYRFKPGHQTWNKGAKGLQLSPATQFAKGHRPANWKPLGTEIVRDGYLCRKVTETGVSAHDYKPVHRLIWEAAHGPVPKGYAVAFKDRRPRLVAAEIALDLLELVSRADLMRENTFHQYGPEIAHLVQLRSAVSRQINKRSRQHGE